ncbi:MAG TPA: globin [Acidimicrobiales bacterium]
MESLYQRVGGDDFFSRLVERFYEGVAGDPVLRPLYPTDLTAPREHLAAFLVQYWGGPATYSEQRGHPRLRLRHAPFVIGDLERVAWLRHMTDAVQGSGAPPDVQQELLAYFDLAARSLLNA